MRLIDSDKLTPLWMNNEDGLPITGAVLLDDILNAQTVDAMPIVKCKDCKYYDEQTFMGHSMGWASCSGRFKNVNDNGMRFEIPSEDWFCADGERREDGGK